MFVGFVLDGVCFDVRVVRPEGVSVLRVRVYERP